MKRIEMFQLANGLVPFEDWILNLPEATRGRIYNYITRVAAGGSKKNIRSLGDGVFEIKIDHGPGYRVYFGEIENVIILLLLGGDKSTQRKDILMAKEYWRLRNV